MKRILVSMAMILSVCLSAFAQQSKKDMDKTEYLVVYFSATGTTAGVAREIAAAVGGDIFEIVPEKAYTRADLDWNNSKSRSSVEMNDAGARPALKTVKTDVSRYDVIFIGYPIWWNLPPRIINTFIESHNLKGKTLVPFATSGGSGIENSVRYLKKTYLDLKWESGRLLNGMGKDAVDKWAKGF